MYVTSLSFVPELYGLIFGSQHALGTGLSWQIAFVSAVKCTKSDNARLEYITYKANISSLLHWRSLRPPFFAVKLYYSIHIRIEQTVKMVQKILLCSYLSAIILVVYYTITASALPGMDSSPVSNLRLNISSLSARPPREAKKDYMIWPDERGNATMASNIDRAMAAIVPRAAITPFTSRRNGIEFWEVTATDRQAQSLSHIQHVSLRREQRDKIKTADLNIRPEWLKTRPFSKTIWLRLLPETHRYLVHLISVQIQ